MYRLFQYTFIATCLFSSPSFAKDKTYDDALLNKFIAMEYAKFFADEFSRMPYNQLKTEYATALLDKKDHYGFGMRFKSKPAMRAEGATLILSVDGQDLFRMEILDLLGQRYKINGKLYTHAWIGNAATQKELIKRTVPRVQALNPIWNLFVPEVQALFPVLGAAAAEGCAAGGCAALWFVAQRAAVWVVVQGSSRVAAAAVAGSTAFRTRAAPAMANAARVTIERAKAIKDSALQHEKVQGYKEGIKSGVDSTAKVLSDPAYIIIGPVETLKWLAGSAGALVKMSAMGAGAGGIGWYINNVWESRKVAGGVVEGVKCTVNGKTASECGVSSGMKLTKGITPKNDQFRWCAHPLLNETQTLIKRPDGTTDGLTFRVGMKDGATTGEATRALTFRLRNDGKLIEDSLRFYDIKEGVIDKIQTMDIDQDFDTKLLIPIRIDSTSGNDQEVIDDMKEKLKQRDFAINVWRASRPFKPVVIENITITSEAAKKFPADPLAAEGSDGAKKLNEEMKATNSLLEKIRKFNDVCNSLDEIKELAGPKATAAAPTAAGSAKATN